MLMTDVPLLRRRRSGVSVSDLNGPSCFFMQVPLHFVKSCEFSFSGGLAVRLSFVDRRLGFDDRGNTTEPRGLTFHVAAPKRFAEDYARAIRDRIVRAKSLRLWRSWDETNPGERAALTEAIGKSPVKLGAGQWALANVGAVFEVIPEDFDREPASTKNEATTQFDTADQDLPSAPALNIAPAGWHQDPARRHQLRYWDGNVWSPHVSDAGLMGLDPI